MDLANRVRERATMSEFKNSLKVMATFHAARIDTTVAAKVFSATMRLARPGANESCRTNYSV